MRKTLSIGLAVGLAGLLATAVVAGNIAGTPKSDTLRGSAKADKIDGKAGNDKLYGLGGKDVLIGGAGNDLLVGGAGADTLNCGPGKDAAQADDLDKVSPSCESVKGLSPPPRVSIADATVVEGQTGAAKISFEVTLSAASKKPASVGFATADGTAAAPGDYAAVNGTLTFKPGEKSKTIDVAVVSDPIAEPDESFSVKLSSPVNATIAKGSAAGSITNDDVRSGRYAGSTSQGKRFSVDVDPSVTSVSNLSMVLDLNCVEVPVTLADLPLDLPGRVAPIAGDWSFSVNISDSDADASINISFSGKLSMPGNASGTVRIDLALNTGAGVVNCSTGNLNWTAQAG